MISDHKNCLYSPVNAAKTLVTNFITVVTIFIKNCRSFIKINRLKIIYKEMGFF